MKRFLRLKLVLSLAALMVITTAFVIPLSSSILHTHAQGTVTITEFPTSTSNSGPEGITKGPDGNLWFTEASGNKIGKITPNGNITEYPIPTSNSFPFDITKGPDGNLWFTEYQGNNIGKITPNGSIIEYPIPPNSGSGGAQIITTGPDNNLWFTEAFTNKIGQITTNGNITEFSTPTINSAPNGIITGPDGNLWLTELYGNNIAKVTTSGNFIEYPIPTSVSYPYGITTGPDGNLWFVEAGGNKIGKITTSGSISEFSLPANSSDPYRITTGPDNNLWFTRGWGNNIGKMTLDGTVTEYSASHGLVRDITSGPDGNLWFTETSGYIGRVNLVSTTSPSIIVNPTQAQPGTTVTITGNSWTPGDVVDISLSTSASVLTKATVAGDGTISTSFTVPQNALTGTQFINAKDETTNQIAQATFTITHNQLFVLLQGLDTGLSQQDVDSNGGLGKVPDFENTINNVIGIRPYLQSQFPDAKFLAFSYLSSNPANGHPFPYSCLDTFQNSISHDALLLGNQIASYLKTQPQNSMTDIYLIGHSLGGAVALSYLTALLKAPGNVIPLPANGHLAGVITLDSPVGGVSSNKGFLNFTFNFFKQNAGDLFGCLALTDKKTQFTSVMDLARLFDTTSQPTFPPNDDGTPGSQGAHASILKAIFKGQALTNQGLVETAAGQGIPVLTIGNTIDYLYTPGACLLAGGNFMTSQWVDDEGPHESSLEGQSPVAVYGREFKAGQSTCPTSLPFLINHKEVYNNVAVETAILLFLPNGGNPAALLEAPPELS